MAVAARDSVRNSFGNMSGGHNLYESDNYDENGEAPLIPRENKVKDGLTPLNFSAYSVGHVYNDF